MQMKEGKGVLVEADIPGIIIIGTFNRRAIADERIEHHRGIHQVIIPCNTLPDIIECLHLGSRHNPVPNPHTFAVPAIRAVTVNRHISIGTRYDNLVFLLIALEYQ